MTVLVLYFAAIRDLVGLAEERVSIAPGASVEALAAELVAHHPAFEGHLAYVCFARNEVLVQPDERLSDGDVVAVLPPFSGG